MSFFDDNSRAQSIRWLQEASNVFDDCFQRNQDDKETATKCGLFLEGYNESLARNSSNLIKKPAVHKPQELNVNDFLNSQNEFFDPACERLQVSQSSISLFADKLNFTINKKPPGNVDIPLKKARMNDEVRLDKGLSENSLRNENSKEKNVNSTLQNIQPTSIFNPWKNKCVNKVQNETSKALKKENFHLNSEKRNEPAIQSIQQKLTDLYAKPRNQMENKPKDKKEETFRDTSSNKNKIIHSSVQKNFANILRNNEEEPKDDPTKIKDPYAAYKTAGQILNIQANSKNNDINYNSNARLKKFHPIEEKLTSASKSEDTLNGLSKELLQRIEQSVVVNAKNTSWDDIIGQKYAIQQIHEAVIYPSKHPEIFTGLCKPARGILLFGPPGTGKTLIGRCIASSCSATFMSISASTLLSKWSGESENLVRALFEYAKAKQPTVIFFDEIDSLLGKRTDSEGGSNECVNRVKTEFLYQLDGVQSFKDNDRVIFIGCTNRPQAIDEAMLRRFSKKILINLPTLEARAELFQHCFKNHPHRVSPAEFQKLAQKSEGYSSADITKVCEEAAMIPLRQIDLSKLERITKDDIPTVTYRDIVKALRHVKPTTSEETLQKLNEWNERFGNTVNYYESDDDDEDITIMEED